MRLKLAQVLTRAVPPHVFESSRADPRDLFSIALKIEISGHHDDIANGHAAWPGEHVPEDVGHFAGLEQATGIVDMLGRSEALGPFAGIDECRVCSSSITPADGVSHE